MTEAERRLAAREFAADWEGRGDEKQETQAFWMALLQKVYGVAEPEKYIEFEVRVKLDHTSFIDGLIKPTRVLIEQKSFDIDLLKGYKQSDSSVLTPFQQARRYAGYLPHDQNPRWIIVCNFQEFHIHDMNRPNDAPEILKLADLEKEYRRLNFLVDTGDENTKREMELSMQAGELVGRLYDAFMRQYNHGGIVVHFPDDGLDVRFTGKLRCPEPAVPRDDFKSAVLCRANQNRVDYAASHDAVDGGCGQDLRDGRCRHGEQASGALTPTSGRRWRTSRSSFRRL